MGIILLILGFAAGFVFAASRQPDDFRVSRSALFKASPAAVFEQVNDMDKWQAWSPWVKMDPDAKNTHEGPKAGVGAIVSWDGKKTGQGRMTLIESTPNSLVRFKLEFFKPMKAENEAVFTITEENGQSRLTWTMTGKSSFAGKIIGLAMNCDKMVSGQFDDGLANIRAIIEK